MSFLLKSAFWLTIVVSCMDWPGGERPDTVVRQAAGDIAARTQAVATERASAACAGSPGECLALAARATTLAQKISPARATGRPGSLN